MCNSLSHWQSTNIANTINAKGFRFSVLLFQSLIDTI